MKMKKVNFKKIKYFALTIIFSGILNARAPINLFRPTDRPFIPEYHVAPFEFKIGYEGSVDSRGFQDDFDECSQIGRSCQKNDSKVNVLQIYQNEQNFLAALKGFNSTKKIGQFSQLFNIDDENGNQGLFIPRGKFNVTLNFLFSAYYNFNHNVSFSLNLPVIEMELKNVRWKPIGPDAQPEDEQSLIDFSKDFANLDITNWKRSGIGDLVAQVSWFQNFPQYKPLIINVRPQIRVGVNIPTGKKKDEDRILAIPFGNDGSWGIQLAGGLDLDLRYCTRAGIDVELLFLFGNTRCRRIKTNCNQTDLLFFNKVPAFKEFGLGQQFNLYLESLWNGVAFRLNYQYLKRNEDKLFLCNDRFDPFIVNTAENLQEWTTHSFIFNLNYDFSIKYQNIIQKPKIGGWFKLGFNGKRAILLDTLGVSLDLRF